MDTDVEDLEVIADVEKLEKKGSDVEKELSYLRDYEAQLEERLKRIESCPERKVPKYEELLALLTPAPPDLSQLARYEPAPLGDLSECVARDERPEITQEEIEEEVERKLEQWRATLDPSNQAILRREIDIESEVEKDLEMWRVTLDPADRALLCGEEVPLTECKENEQDRSAMLDSNTQSDSNREAPPEPTAMDIEFTAEIPKAVLVAPATEVRPNRRALQVHQTDSAVKRTRRSARF